METPKDLHDLANKQESQGVKVFYKALKMQYTDLAKQYENEQDLVPNKDIIKKAIIAFHSKVQLEMANWQFNELNKQVSVKSLGLGSYEKIVSLIRAWITLNTGKSVTSISNTTLDVIRKVINKGQQEGFGARKIAKLIRDEAKEPITVYRSTVIARTEGTRAASQGAKFGAQQWENLTGQKKWKAWSATADKRTRDQHLAMIGTWPIEGTDEFIVGGVEMDAPGDPKGGVTNCANCRCRVLYMSERVAKNIIADS